MRDVELRDLTEDDLDWVAAQEQDIFGAAAWSLSLLREDFRYGLRRYRGAVGANREGDDELVGYAVYGFDGDAFHLMNLAVVPAWRGRGIGRIFMEDLLAEAASVRAPEIWLEVAVDNAAALALYESQGFERVRIRRRYYQPGDIDAVVMRRRTTLGA